MKINADQFTLLQNIIYEKVAGAERRITELINKQFAKLESDYDKLLQSHVAVEKQLEKQTEATTERLDKQIEIYRSVQKRVEERTTNDAKATKYDALKREKGPKRKKAKK